MEDVTLKEYKNFEENYVSTFFPKNMDTWSSRILLETVNDKELMDEVKYYIDLCRNNISSADLDKLLEQLHLKIKKSLEEVKQTSDGDSKFRKMSKTMIYVGMFESIDELSTFCDDLINSIRYKYGKNYLKIIQEVDKSNLSVDGKKVLIEGNYKDISDDLLKKYLVLKRWQDINHNLYYQAVEPLLNDIEGTYVEESNTGKFDFDSPLMLQKLNYLDSKKIIDIDELSKYYLAGLDKELIKIIGGKGYGLTVLNSKELSIPSTYILPVSSNYDGDDELLDGIEYFSVRSSADIEDGDKNSFAGMFDSYLNVSKNELLRYIDLVKKSKNNDRVKKYVEHYNLENPNMAVVLQKFVEPEKAGVWIGKDLNSGVLEYIDGNGEKLVSGRINPNREICTVDYNDSNALECDDGKVGKLLLDIQRKIGVPSDFEWMILNGKLIMLQYRPVTSKIDIGNMKNTIIDDEESYSGIPASPGVVAGPARFINAKYIDKIDDWKTGDILMAWFTDPEWMNILSNSSGIVTAVGGFLCHSAIIARELGIPCVIGIGQDMKKIWDEKEITINGDSGKVYKGVKTLTRKK